MKTQLTPWEIKENLDYEKLIKEFGLESISELPPPFKKELLFRRKIIFAHRDFKKITKAIHQKKKFIMMTGLMPTGRFHLGHALIAKQFVFYQKLGAKIYIAIADLEAHNVRKQSLQESRRIALEDYLPNYIALGLNIKKADIYFQSERSNESKKSNAYYRLQNLLAKYLTFNELKATYGEITPGKILSAFLQASDMLHPQLPEFEGVCPTVIPVGVDQDPHIRLARDLVQRIKDYKFEQISSTYNLFMPGLKGGKMSASDPHSYIAMTDTPDIVKKKINKYAFSGGQPTIEEHRLKGGNPDIDVSFQYLRMLLEENDEKLQQIRDSYKTGKLSTSELKNYTIQKLNIFLSKHQAKLEEAKRIVKENFAL